MVNVYAYCDDNPVGKVDSSGESALSGVFGVLESVGSDILGVTGDAAGGFVEGLEGGPLVAAIGAIYGVVKSSVITIDGGDLPYRYQANSGSSCHSSSTSSS